MAELLENFESLSWWVSVVVMALVVGLLVEYVKPLIDRLVRYAFNKSRLAWDSSERQHQKALAVVESQPAALVVVLLMQIKAILGASFFVFTGVLVFAVLTQYPALGEGWKLALIAFEVYCLFGAYLGLIRLVRLYFLGVVALKASSLSALLGSD
jgi:hypothetical protein